MLRIYPQREDYTSNKLKGLPVIVTSHRGNSAFSINPFNSFCDSLEKGSRSSFILYNYDNEKIKPYYYSVFLSDYDIEVKYVPSHQSALYQLDFRAGQPGLLIGATNGELHVEKNKVFGYRKSVPMRQDVSLSGNGRGSFTNGRRKYCRNEISRE
jgi:hypothetical protein